MLLRKNLLHGLNEEKSLLPQWVDFRRELYKPQFTIRDLGLQPQNLNYWVKEGLIPLEFKKASRGWKQLNYVELTWLQMLLRFREVGVAIDLIRVAKEELFKHIDLLSEPIETEFMALFAEYEAQIHEATPEPVEKPQVVPDQDPAVDR